MLLSEIKEYLQIIHLELDEGILQSIEEKRKNAIICEDEQLANELWCLREVYKVQETYLKMFHNLKCGNYEVAWYLLDRIDISIGILRDNFEYGINKYNLIFINAMLKNYEKVFPDYVFTSRESIIKSEKCSICGKKARLRGGCEHIPGKLYMGELCLREVTEMEFLGVAIVKTPLDKYAILKVEGMDYNYQILEYLMSKLESPFRPWYVEELRRKRPEYIKLGRNDKCPCGSGKKYKYCCINNEKEYAPHFRITLLGGEEMKEEMIDYSGRWKIIKTIE